jgi:hypothetical protein
VFVSMHEHLFVCQGSVSRYAPSMAIKKQGPVQQDGQSHVTEQGATISLPKRDAVAEALTKPKPAEKNPPRV